jgi:hypothetical protein
MSGWLRTGDDLEQHVIPVDDLIDHEDDQGCICGPAMALVKRPDGSACWLYKHPSLDRRELQETEHA